MRVMLKASFPAAVGSKALKDGSLAKLVESFMKQYKPEAAYFFPDGGKRTMMYVFDLPDTTHLPVAVEPFFMQLEAEVTLTPVMTLDDLQAGLKKAMK